MSNHHATGPVTEAGKQTVSHNALKHGLTANTHAALPGEESALEHYCAEYKKSLGPIGIVEENLVRSIAENYWRLRRAHLMEDALFERALLEAGDAAPAEALADAWIDSSKGLQRIALYAARIQRAIDKATADLNALQAERRATYLAAREEAVLLTQLALSQGKSFDPAESFGPPRQHGGFVYSSDEILRFIIHTDRLREARMTFSATPAQTIK